MTSKGRNWRKKGERRGKGQQDLMFYIGDFGDFSPRMSVRPLLDRHKITAKAVVFIAAPK